jgi:rare lipoprotein A
LSGKHAEAETARPEPKSSIAPKVHRMPSPSRVVPLVSALLVAGVVVAAAATTMTLGPATDTSSSALTTATSPSVTASLAARGSDERASRSGLREDPAPSSAAPKTTTPAPSPSTKKPAPPSGGGAVTSSGTCGASFYSDGQRTANGEYFNPNDFTAANRTLPFNTRVRVTNVANGKATVVRINDRGPFVYSRCLDLSRAAFGAIASLGAGVITVKYEVLS